MRRRQTFGQVRIQSLRLFAVIAVKYLLLCQYRGCRTAILREKQLNWPSMAIKTTNPWLPTVITAGSQQ